MTTVAIDTATLTIQWSEDDMLRAHEGQALPLAYGAALMQARDVLRRTATRGGYWKTGFQVTYPDPDHPGQSHTWEGRMDLGADARTLADHMRYWASDAPYERHARLFQSPSATEAEASKRQAAWVVSILDALAAGHSVLDVD